MNTTRSTNPWAPLSLKEKKRLKYVVDPTVGHGSKGSIPLRNGHDTSPWSGDAEICTYRSHEIHPMRKKQQHDTTPWATDKNESSCNDTASVCSSVSSVAPWEKENLSERSTRMHFPKRSNTSRHIWYKNTRKGENNPQDVVDDLVRRGMRAETIMEKLAELYDPKKRRGRKRHGILKLPRRDEWPDGTIKDTHANGFALIRRPSGQKEVLAPSGQVMVIEGPREKPIADGKIEKKSSTSIAPMPFDRVYGRAHEGKDTRSSIVLGNERPSSIDRPSKAPLGFTAPKTTASSDGDDRTLSPAVSLHRVTRQLAYASRNAHRTGQIRSLG